ncbi:MAG: HAMP domain-containing protein [Anaerolineales bacterium]|nr:HAMP domain-containing protein [Anaerolineales bacterium]
MAPASPPRNPWRGLTSQIIVFGIVPLVVLAFVVPIASLNLHAQAMRQLVGERDRRMTQAAAAALSEQLAHHAAAAQSLAVYAATGASAPAVFQANAHLLADFSHGAALLTPAGQLAASTGAAAADNWRAWLTPALFQNAAAGGAAHFALVPAAAPPAPPLMLVIARAADGTGAAGAFSPAELAHMIIAPLVTADAHSHIQAWVVAGDYQVLYESAHPLGEGGPRQHPGVAEALAGASGTQYLQLPDGEHVVAYSAIPPVGWALLLEEPWEAADNPLLSQTQAAPLLLIPVLVVALLAIGFGLRQIVQPLQALERQAAQLGQGAFDAVAPPVGGIAEVKSLQETLRRMAGRLQTYQSAIRGYAGALTRSQEDERRRLARELHDDTVQALIVLDQKAQATAQGLKRGAPDAPERVAELRQQIAALIAEVRRVIRALRPIYLEDLGLLPALEMLVQERGQAAGLQTEFVVTGQPLRLAPEAEIAIYRIVQEGLNNSLRHAQAARVQVEIRCAPAEFELSLQDNGRGFAVPDRLSDLTTAGHYGLLGMRERAELIGAQLELRSTPGAGTRLTLRLPLS